MNVKEKVIAFLEARNKLPGVSDKEKLACNYLDTGIIDSMGIVTMIMEFEQNFGIHFEAEDLQSFEFQSVGGLIQIIEKLISKKQ